MKKEIFRQIDKLGRLVIPADLRKVYGLKQGERVYFCAKDDGILIRSEDFKNEQKDDNK